MNKLSIIKQALLFTMPMMLLTPWAHAKLEALDNTSLSKVAGQSLLSMNYIDPTTSGNVSNLGFYSLGIAADIQLNANAKRLQLGCGGINGAGSCDIDLSNVRITGSKPGPSGTFADSDGTLSNPFFQFAIKNPNSAATRQVVGFAIGAQSTDLLLSIGQNPDPSQPGKVGGTQGGETGINVISGSFEGLIQNLRNPMVINAALGLIPLATGNAYVQTTSTQPSTSSTLMTQEQGNNVKTGAYYQFVSGQRMTGFNLGPISLIVPNLYAAGINIGSLTARATYTPFNLIDLHNLYIGPNPNSGFQLSVNSQPILWPQIGTQGVWSFPTTAQNIDTNGNITTRGYNSSGNTITMSDLMAQRGWWLSAPQATVGDSSGFVTTSTEHVDSPVALAGLALGNITVGPVNSGQIPTHNCYGGLTFC